MNLIFLRKTETLLVHFWTTIYITSEFDFYEKSRNFIGLVLAIISITSDLIFETKKKNRNFIDLVLDNNLHN